MLNANKDTQPRLLITRFAPHADRLSILLNEVGVFSIAQPLLKVVKTDEFDYADEVLNNGYDHIIAVSVNAVEYTQLAASKKWPENSYFAVGKATKLALENVTNQWVSAPEQHFNSEGLLALPLLQNVKNKRILILRGKGGREFLANTLKERGAIVDYHQSYQRVVVENADARLIKKCQQKQLNGAIITSTELLNQLILITPSDELAWLKSIKIYSASKRIAESAKRLGWQSVCTLPGLSDKEIINYFKQ